MVTTAEGKIVQLRGEIKDSRDNLSRAQEGLNRARKEFAAGTMSQRKFSLMETQVNRERDRIYQRISKKDKEISDILVRRAGGDPTPQKEAVFRKEGVPSRPTYLKPPPPSEARFYEQVESERYGTMYVPKERVDVEAKAEERIPLGVEDVRLPTIDLAARRTPIEEVRLLTKEKRIKFLRETGQEVEPITVSPGVAGLFETRREEIGEVLERKREEKWRKKIAVTPIKELIEPGREAVGVSIKQAFANFEKELKAKSESLFGTKERPRPIVGEVKTGELLVTRGVTAKGKTVSEIMKEVTIPGKVLFPQIAEVTAEVGRAIKGVTKDIPILGYKAIRFVVSPKGRQIISETTLKAAITVKKEPVAIAKIVAAVGVIKGGQILVATAEEAGRRPFGFATEAILIGKGIKGVAGITKVGVKGVGRISRDIGRVVTKTDFIKIPKIIKPTITKARIEITAPIKKPSVTIVSVGIPTKELRLMVGIVPSKKISITQIITRRVFAPELIVKKPLFKFSMERIVGKVGLPGRIPIYKMLRLKTGLFDIRYGVLKPGQMQRLIGARPIKRPSLIDILMRKPLVTETGEVVGIKLIGYRLRTVSIVPLPPHLKKLFKPVKKIKLKKIKPLPFEPKIPKGYVEVPVGKQVLLQKLKPLKLKAITKQKVVAIQKARQRTIQRQLQLQRQVSLQKLTLFPRLRATTISEQRRMARQLAIPMLRFKQVKKALVIPITKQVTIQKSALISELASWTLLKPALIPRQAQVQIQDIVPRIDTRQALKQIQVRPMPTPIIKFPYRPRKAKPKKLKKRIKRATRYNPNLGAIIASATGKRPRVMTGLERRPIPRKRLKKRRRR